MDIEKLLGTWGPPIAAVLLLVFRRGQASAETDRANASAHQAITDLIPKLRDELVQLRSKIDAMEQMIDRLELENTDLKKQVQILSTINAQLQRENDALRSAPTAHDSNIG